MDKKIHSNLHSTNPLSGEVFKHYAEFSTAEVNQHLEATAASFNIWRNSSFSERASCLQACGKLLRQEADRLAMLMAREMGKTLVSGKAEIEKSAAACEYFAVHAEKMLATELIKTDASKSYVTYQPLGTILAVMPWNFPFWQVFRAAGTY
jgi:succinate-semialdehyde dehydrogenase/glutarate-semialdehyde dehydrogenase